MVEVPGLGEVAYDLAFGGNFYAIVELDRLGLPFERSRKDDLLRAGLEHHGRHQRRRASPCIPSIETIRGCHHVYLQAPGSTARHSRHAMAIHPGWFDRSPCGTGTSARMAQLHARGDLPLHTDFVNESFIGTQFVGRLVEETDRRRHPRRHPHDHGTGLGDRHRPVHARSLGPVPARVPAVSAVSATAPTGIPVIGVAEMEAALDRAGAVAAIEAALHGGVDIEADAPRLFSPLTAGEFLLMPSQSPQHAGIKVVTIAPANPARDLPKIQAWYLLFEAETLAPVAILEGAHLTLLRTPAVTAVAVRALLAADPAGPRGPSPRSPCSAPVRRPRRTCAPSPT